MGVHLLRLHTGNHTQTIWVIGKRAGAGEGGSRPGSGLFRVRSGRIPFGPLVLIPAMLEPLEGLKGRAGGGGSGFGTGYRPALCTEEIAWRTGGADGVWWELLIVEMVVS